MRPKNNQVILIHRWARNWKYSSYFTGQWMLVYMVTPIYIGRFINNTLFHPEICPQLSLACSNYSYTLWALKYSLWTPICPSVHRKSIFYCSFDIVWIGKNSHRNTFLHLILSYSNVARSSTVLLTALHQEMSQSDNCPDTNVYNMLSSEIDGDEEYCVCQNFPFKEHMRGVWTVHLHWPTEG